MLSNTDRFITIKSRSYTFWFLMLNCFKLQIYSGILIMHNLITSRQSTVLRGLWFMNDWLVMVLNWVLLVENIL